MALIDCQACEERRKKIKGFFNDSMQSINDAIARLTGQDCRAEQPTDTAEQSTDTDVAATRSDDVSNGRTNKRTTRSIK